MAKCSLAPSDTANILLADAEVPGAAIEAEKLRSVL
jgi:hypothetical protein